MSAFTRSSKPTLQSLKRVASAVNNRKREVYLNQFHQREPQPKINHKEEDQNMWEELGAQVANNYSNDKATNVPKLGLFTKGTDGNRLFLLNK